MDTPDGWGDRPGRPPVTPPKRYRRVRNGGMDACIDLKIDIGYEARHYYY